MSDSDRDLLHLERLDAEVIDVADDAGLAALVDACREAGVVALDTEFERTDSYFPRLALVQLHAGDRIWLLDPLPLEDPAPLRELLEDGGVTKLMHSVSEDVEVLHHFCEAQPSAVFDTQLGAAFLGERFGIGYRDLVQGTLGVEVEKDATRSNWLQRPLTPAQRRYAALDVLYLPELHARQAPALEATGRRAWHAEECAARVAEGLHRVAPEDIWRNVKGASALQRHQLAVLRELAAWREVTARERDRPRGWIVKDEHLVALATRLPEQEAELPTELPPAVRRRWGARLVEAVRRGLAVPEDDWPQPPKGRLSREEGDLLKTLRQLAREQAHELGLAEELLARRKLIETLFEDDEQARVAFAGWRWPVVGERLMAVRDRSLGRRRMGGGR